MNATRPPGPATRRGRTGALLIALAALAVSGCAHTTDVPKDGTLRVALTEYRVIPQDVHTTSGVLTLVVHNYGRLTHNLVISLNGRSEITTGPLAPGKTAVLDAALIPGQYTMSSTILSDSALGAWGTLDVAR